MGHFVACPDVLAAQHTGTAYRTVHSTLSSSSIAGQKHVVLAHHVALEHSRHISAQLAPQRLRGLQAAAASSLATCLSAINGLTYVAPGASNFQQARSVRPQIMC